MMSRTLRGLAGSVVLALAMGAATTGPVQAANPDMPVGMASRNWAWAKAAIGPMEIYRTFDTSLPATWTGTKAYAVAPNGPRHDWSFNAPPASVINGSMDTRIRDFLATTPKNVILSIWHEPEQEVEAGLYTAEEFRAMMVHFKALVDAQDVIDGGSRLVSVILMISTFRGFKGRNPENYWPGPTGADMIAVDAYNTVQRDANMPVPYTNGRNWKTGGVLLAPVKAFADAHATRWGVSEYGALVDVNDVNRKATAITEGIAYARANDAVMFQYFDSTGGRADWQLRWTLPVGTQSSTTPAVQALKNAIAE